MTVICRTSVQKHFSNPLKLARCCHTQPSQQSNPGEFKTIYRFPKISTARFICRLKLYQSAFIVTLTGVAVATDANLSLPFLLCTISLTMLGIMGEFFRKLIGFVYMDPKTDMVKIAHLNFWGNRKDILCHLNDIVPPSDLGENTSDAYVKIKLENSSIPYLFLSLKYGLVENKELFDRLMGHRD